MDAANFTRQEFLEARRAIASTMAKCEKALDKLTPGKAIKWTRFIVYAS